jgi:hypothetical protein
MYYNYICKKAQTFFHSHIFGYGRSAYPHLNLILSSLRDTKYGFHRTQQFSLDGLSKSKPFLSDQSFSHLRTCQILCTLNKRHGHLSCIAKIVSYFMRLVYHRLTYILSHLTHSMTHLFLMSL